MLYDMAAHYKTKNERKLKLIEEKERQQRIHIAKPMPNFKAIHSKRIVKEPVDCISPETPEVLKRGLATKEKLKQKVVLNITNIHSS